VKAGGRPCGEGLERPLEDRPILQGYGFDPAVDGKGLELEIGILQGGDPQFAVSPAPQPDKEANCLELFERPFRPAPVAAVGAEAIGGEGADWIGAAGAGEIRSGLIVVDRQD